MAKIDYRGAANLDEYLARSEQVRVLLPRLAAFYKQSEATLARHQKQDANNPELLKLGAFFAALNAKDQEGLAVLREEMDRASQMASVKREARQRFFDERIRPLQRKEDLLSKQEIQMAVDARNQGVPLPEDVLKAIANNQ